MEPYLDLTRRKLEATSAAGFDTYLGGYSVSLELNQARRLLEIRSSPERLQSSMLSAVVQPFSFCSARATRLFSSTRVDDDTSTPED